VNLTSFYGILDEAGDSEWLGWAETGQGRMGGTPWEKREAYVENSPRFSLDRVRTPLLLVGGTALGEEAAQAQEAFSALRRPGKDTELRLYAGEGHWPGSWSEPSLRDLGAHVMSWVEAYLKG
jgi:dipeptidyl aminopeptidase/acylaminoacyl peptidase